MMRLGLSALSEVPLCGLQTGVKIGLLGAVLYVAPMLLMIFLSGASEMGFLRALVTGILPGLLTGALAGWIIGIALQRLDNPNSDSHAAQIGAEVTLMIAVIVHLLFVLWNSWSLIRYALSWTYLIPHFFYYLILPSIFYVLAGIWMGRKMNQQVHKFDKSALLVNRAGRLSVDFSFIMWVVGSILIFAGNSVFLFWLVLEQGKVDRWLFPWSSAFMVLGFVVLILRLRADWLRDSSRNG